MNKSILIALMAISLTAQAEVYKCQAGGHIKYQKTPCQAGEAAQVLGIKPLSPDILRRMQYDELERERIELQRIKLQIEAQKAAAGAQNDAARVQAYNRSTDAWVRMHEDHERRQDARDEAWRNYQKCQNRRALGHLSRNNECLLP